MESSAAAESGRVTNGVHGNRLSVVPSHTKVEDMSTVVVEHVELP